MKKLLCIILCAGCLILALSACNKQIIDFDCHFNYAYVRLPNGEMVEGRIKSWNDWSDSDMLQVTSTMILSIIPILRISYLYQSKRRDNNGYYYQAHKERTGR